MPSSKQVCCLWPWSQDCSDQLHAEGTGDGPTTSGTVLVRQYQDQCTSPGQSAAPGPVKASASDGPSPQAVQDPAAY